MHYQPRPSMREPRRRIVVDETPQQAWTVNGLPFGILVREMSAHPDGIDVGRTMSVDIPGGWELPERHWHSCQEEFYVESGELTEGDTTYGPGTYVFRPAGHVAGPLRSENGCRLCYWHDDAPYDVNLGKPPKAVVDDKPFIVVDTGDPRIRKPLLSGLAEGGREVSGYAHTEVQPDVVILRDEDRTGDDVILMYQPPKFELSILSVHEGTEEAFMLGPGFTQSDPYNIYPAGTYLCWDPGVVHGPVCGWDTNVVIRQHGGYTHPPVPIQVRGLDIGLPGWTTALRQI